MQPGPKKQRKRNRKDIEKATWDLEPQKPRNKRNRATLNMQPGAQKSKEQEKNIEIERATWSPKSNETGNEQENLLKCSQKDKNRRKNK